MPEVPLRRSGCVSHLPLPAAGASLVVGGTTGSEPTAGAGLLVCDELAQNALGFFRVSSEGRIKEGLMLHRGVRVGIAPRITRGTQGADARRS
ncbi:hypothetical protein [Cellulomonas sp. KRMCY2]|uniref:hypothetical protein n=1 Tax=Cellulomonas sp. KRMCY2 TaxID=1304865 RepID=UPI00045E9EFD|nr:hypothetical protein [Cellulomonas sp. KRMCY2]